MKKIKNFLVKVLYRPSFTVLFCLVFLFINLLLDGTLVRLVKMNRDLRVVRNRVQYLEKKIFKIQEKMKKISDPDFVEQEARDRLDFVGEGDLIFIFPENL